MPSPDARLSPRPALARPIKKTTDEDGLALLHALLETPLISSDERRRPVALRSLDTRRSPRPHHPAGSTWFDTLLQRASQVLFISAALVLSYWCINVPISNWLHNWRAPTVRASAALPSAAALRLAPTRTMVRVAHAAPDLSRSAPPNDSKVPQQRASAVPIHTSSAEQVGAPRGTEPLTIGQQIRVPALAADSGPTATIPQPTASPRIQSPSLALVWPTMIPVQLGAVSKPSPVPNQPTVARPAAAAKPSAGHTLPTHLLIPALSLDLPIKEVFIVGDQWEIAKYAAGYMHGSGLPGVPGNLAINGHAGLYGGVFAHLGALNPGDDIYIDAASVRYHYRLRTSSAVWPNQIDVLDSTETPTMTLITCTNWDTQRLIATADFVDSGPALDR